MIAIRSTAESPIVVDMALTKPSVYLDYCVIGDLACERIRGDKVRNLLVDRGGTLCFSWVHLVELYGLGHGPTYDAITGYLATFGPSFALIEAIPGVVIQRESEWRPGLANPLVDIDLTKQLIAQWDARRPIDLSVLADLLARAPELQSQLQQMQETWRAKVKSGVDDARVKYQTDKTARNNVDAIAAGQLIGSRTSHIYERAVNECIRTHEVFNESDSFDFFHAVVSSAWADIVVLDKKWARRLRKLSLPPGTATILDTTEGDGLVSWLEKVKAYPAPGPAAGHRGVQE